MRRIVIPLTMVLLAATAPLASADETKADCEPGQYWIGYLTSEPVRQFYTAIGSPGGATVCEGEHWDGADTVQSDSTGTTGPCHSVPRADPNDLFVGLCQDADINGGTPDGPNPIQSLTPVGARVSAAGSDGRQEAYVGTNILFVGRSAVYYGHCTQGATGLEGDATCDGARQTRTAVYLRDNSPGNVLATVVSSLGITRGYVSEGDCDQATYQKGALENDRTLCGRDNTAITVETLA